MARKSYKSYGNHSLSKRHRRRNIQWFIVAIVVLAVLLSVLLKGNLDKETVAEVDDPKLLNHIMPKTVKIDDPPKPQKKPVAVKPKPVKATPVNEVKLAQFLDSIK